KLFELRVAIHEHLLVRDDLRHLGGEHKSLRRFFGPTLHGCFGRNAIEGGVNLDAVKVLRVVAEKVSGLGTLRIERTLPPGGGEGGGADVERSHERDSIAEWTHA